MVPKLVSSNTHSTTCFCSHINWDDFTIQHYLCVLTGHATVITINHAFFLWKCTNMLYKMYWMHSRCPVSMHSCHHNQTRNKNRQLLFAAHVNLLFFLKYTLRTKIIFLLQKDMHKGASDCTEILLRAVRGHPSLPRQTCIPPKSIVLQPIPFYIQCAGAALSRWVFSRSDDIW